MCFFNCLFSVFDVAAALKRLTLVDWGEVGVWIVGVFAGGCFCRRVGECKSQRSKCGNASRSIMEGLRRRPAEIAESHGTRGGHNGAAPDGSGSTIRDENRPLPTGAWAQTEWDHGEPKGLGRPTVAPREPFFSIIGLPCA